MKDKSHIVLMSLMVLFLASCSHNHPAYIAHAGGCIDGVFYTNSLEAIDHAISCGIKIVELDLVLTTDGDIVAAHDWPSFHAATGHKGDSCAICTSEFRARKIHGRYTPVTAAMIDSVMVAHPDIYLMTDKISDPGILQQLPHRKRIMVEAFTLHDYFALKKMGFYKVFYSQSPEPYQSVLARRKQQSSDTPAPPVPERYTFWVLGEGHRDNTPDYVSAYGKEFAVFAVPNRHAADSLAALDKRIKYVYIDEVE